MFTWRRTLATCAAVLLLAGARASAVTVVIVRTSDDEPFKQAEASLRQKLEEQHYTVKSLLAREVSDHGIDASIGKPEMVVAIGSAAARWLHKQLPADVKLTYCMVSHAGDANLLQGHTCSGITTDVPIAAQLKLVTEALPNARTIGLMYRSDTAEGKTALEELQKAVEGTSWRLESVAVNDSPAVADAIDSMMQKQVDIVWTTVDPKLWNNSSVRSLLTAAVRKKVPVWGFSPPLVRAGALLGTGIDPAAQGQQAADLVIKIIRAENQGADVVAAAFKTEATAPASVPIAVNTTVAEQIGIDIPESLSHRAKVCLSREIR